MVIVFGKGKGLSQSDVQALIDATPDDVGITLPFGGWVSQNYYTLSGLTGHVADSTAGNALTANEIHASLFPVPVSTTFDQVSITIITGVALSTIRLGVYTVGADGLPDQLIADWGTVPSLGASSPTISISWNPDPGWYYLACSSSHGPSTVRMTSGVGCQPFGISTMTHTSKTDWIKASPGSAAALPASYGASPTSTGTHRPIWLRSA
jgi:hypothetical protein